MHSLFVVAIAAVVVFAAIVILDTRYGLFRAADHFDSPLKRGLAYAWLGLFLLFVTYLVAGSARRVPTREQLIKTPFYQLFALHLILVVFLFVWWLLSGRPNVFAYLNIQRQNVGRAIVAGCAIGVVGRILSELVAPVIARLLPFARRNADDPTVPAMRGLPLSRPRAHDALVGLPPIAVHAA